MECAKGDKITKVTSCKTNEIQTSTITPSMHYNTQGNKRPEKIGNNYPLCKKKECYVYWKPLPEVSVCKSVRLQKQSREEAANLYCFLCNGKRKGGSLKLLRRFGHSDFTKRCNPNEGVTLQ